MRQGAAAGADLDDVIGRAGRNGADDFVQHARVVQEVLSEAFAGAHVSSLPEQWSCAEWLSARAARQC
jgi:hypothetical protein